MAFFLRIDKMARWANIKETAQYMRVSERTIYNAIHTKTALGKLFKKIEGSNKVADLDDIDDLLKGGEK